MSQSNLLNTEIPCLYRKPSLFWRFVYRLFPSLDKARSYENPLGYRRQDLAYIKETLQNYIEPSQYKIEAKGDALLKQNLPAKYKKNQPNSLLNYFTKGFWLIDKGCYVLIKAETGIGKTTLLQKLYKSYATQYPNKHLAFVYAGEDTFAQIDSIPSEARAETVLFLDALDEDAEARHALQQDLIHLHTQNNQPKFQNFQQYLHKLSQTCLQFNKVVLSCRTQFFTDNETEWRDITKHLQLYKIRLDKFTEAEALRYIAQKYKDNPTQLEKANATFHRNQSFFCRPLLLSYFDELINEKGYTFLYEVYAQIIQKWSEKEGKQVESHAHTTTNYEKNLPAFSKDLAYYFYKNNIDSYQTETKEHKHIQEIAKLHNINTIDIQSRSFLHRQTDKEKGNTYRFAHRSFREYFIACLIREGWIQEHDQEGRQENAMRNDNILHFYNEMLVHQVGKQENPHINLHTLEISPFPSERGQGGEAKNLLKLSPNLYARALVLRYQANLSPTLSTWYAVLDAIAPLLAQDKEAKELQKHYVWKAYTAYTQAIKNIDINKLALPEDDEPAKLIRNEQATAYIQTHLNPLAYYARLLACENLLHQILQNKTYTPEKVERYTVTFGEEHILLQNIALQDLLPTTLSLSSGKKHFIDKKTIVIRNSNLTTLHFLAHLTANHQIGLLDMSDNYLHDINALIHFSTLYELNIPHNQIQDITPLQSLTNLEYLQLQYNQIQDITPLQYLSKLEHLEAGHNAIQDIRVLQKHTQLNLLWIAKNPVSDIQTLQKLTHLTQLSIYDTHITAEEAETLRQSLPNLGYLIHTQADAQVVYEQLFQNANKYTKKTFCEAHDLPYEDI